MRLIAIIVALGFSSAHAQITQPAAVLRGYEIVSKHTKISAPAIHQMNAEAVRQGSAYVECPTNKIAVGGGAGTTEPSNFVLIETKPYFKSEKENKAAGWYARFAGANGPTTSTVTIYAVCIADNQ